MYSEKVTDFDVQLISDISVEVKYLKGIKLGCHNRMENVKIYSSNDFKIEFEYETSEES